MNNFFENQSHIYLTKISYSNWKCCYKKYIFLTNILLDRKYFYWLWDIGEWGQEANKYNLITVFARIVWHSHIQKRQHKSETKKI